MLQRCFCMLVLLVMMACEPFDLEKKNFPTCVPPKAAIGVSIGRLDVTFFLENQEGDIGVAGWDPGDGKGKGRVGTRVTYTYEKAGEYNVTLVLANECDDKFTTTRKITVQN
ncbi:PKD domain-containing protein [Spirosoma sp. BT702]|uniref:PKD domain-containing protein n=2 Tax=Spirosoma profusum TaxID=2771354 RepID=A0A926Y111_9BACT|nr:PKD domain-containing protein [Spirosoma profusum]